MAFDPPPAALAARDPWLDNARFVLIALVIFGHLLEPLLDSHPLLGNSYRFIYSFHMPAFAFLSGAVSRSRLDDRLLRGVLFRLLLPYLAFQGLYALAAQWPGWPDDGPDGVVTPYWLLWYLLSLACWRLLLPLFARLRWRLPIALAIALAAGFGDHIGYYLSLSRTLVFFPLFLLGWQLARHWRCRSGAGTRVLAVAVLAALFAVAATSDLDPRWLYGSYGYAELGAPPLEGAALRLLLLGCAMAGTCAFLALMPRRRLPVTALGMRSLGAYVLQGFAINLAVGVGLFASLTALPRAALLPMLLAAAAVAAAALSARPVQRLLAPITAPRWLEQRLWRP
jgi:fucose 4-O-acetylase-like acetyltransferase